jgi:hypothetical protein
MNIKKLLGFEKPVPPTPEPLTEIKPQEQNWFLRYEQQIRDTKIAFKNLIAEPNPQDYETLPQGQYPEETDEVWVEMHSGEDGVRYTDLVGFVVLSRLREIVNNGYESMPTQVALKNGERFPVGSSAFKLARRRIVRTEPT